MNFVTIFQIEHIRDAVGNSELYAWTSVIPILRNGTIYKWHCATCCNCLDSRYAPMRWLRIYILRTTRYRRTGSRIMAMFLLSHIWKMPLSMQVTVWLRPEQMVIGWMDRNMAPERFTSIQDYRKSRQSGYVLKWMTQRGEKRYMVQRTVSWMIRSISLIIFVAFIRWNSVSKR